MKTIEKILVKHFMMIENSDDATVHGISFLQTFTSEMSQEIEIILCSGMCN